MQNLQSGKPHALQPSPPYGSLGISKHRASVSVSPLHSHPSGWSVGLNVVVVFFDGVVFWVGSGGRVVRGSPPASKLKLYGVLKAMYWMLKDI